MVDIGLNIRTRVSQEHGMSAAPLHIYSSRWMEYKSYYYYYYYSLGLHISEHFYRVTSIAPPPLVRLDWEKTDDQGDGPLSAHWTGRALRLRS